MLLRCFFSALSLFVCCLYVRNFFPRKRPLMYISTCEIRKKSHAAATNFKAPSQLEINCSTV